MATSIPPYSGFVFLLPDLYYYLTWDPPLAKICFCIWNSKARILQDLSQKMVCFYNEGKCEMGLVDCFILSGMSGGKPHVIYTSGTFDASFTWANDRQDN